MPSLAQIHFCGESFKGVQLVDESEIIDCCGTKKCCDCCHDVQISVDTDDHSTENQTLGSNFKAFTPANITYSYYVWPLYSNVANNAVALHPYPLVFAGVKDIIHNHQLVFYA